MASRDYLIRQIEEMGFFLAMLLKRILKMKEEDQLTEIEPTAIDSLSRKMNIDIRQIIMIENSEFLSALKTSLTNDKQIEEFASILKVIGSDPVCPLAPSKINYLTKSLFLFAHLQETSSDFSFERNENIREIEELLLRMGFTSNETCNSL